ncbi:MAG: hypothetical protein IT291_02260 [Deltaproteobacteria bacterium]|nr:hypothetical protein [Deltaproteobacteria bacterium]
MGRPFYPHEIDDPDLDWLVSNFLYERPDFLPVEYGLLPLVLIPLPENHPHKHLLEQKDSETLDHE